MPDVGVRGDHRHSRRGSQYACSRDRLGPPMDSPRTQTFAGSEPPGGTAAMISRAMAITLCCVALAQNARTEAQEGPLEDPIPRPIPQSHVRISLTPVVTGLKCPIYMALINGDRARTFLVDQTGLVLILTNGTVQQTPFLDITAVLSQLSPAFPGAPAGVNPGYDERGLLGLAFHPGFMDPTSPGFRTLYTLHNV